MGNQTCAGGIGWTGKIDRQTVKPLGFAHTDLLVENMGRKVAHPGELARPAGENGPSARNLVQATRLQAAADKFESLFQAGLNDPR